MGLSWLTCPLFPLVIIKRMFRSFGLAVGTLAGDDKRGTDNPGCNEMCRFTKQIASSIPQFIVIYAIMLTWCYVFVFFSLENFRIIVYRKFNIQRKYNLTGQWVERQKIVGRKEILFSKLKQQCYLSRFIDIKGDDIPRGSVTFSLCINRSGQHQRYSVQSDISKIAEQIPEPVFPEAIIYLYGIYSIYTDYNILMFCRVQMKNTCSKIDRKNDFHYPPHTHTWDVYTQDPERPPRFTNSRWRQRESKPCVLGEGRNHNIAARGGF